MPVERSPSNSKDFRYSSPSKQSIETPVRNALRNSKYRVGVFLEKMNELNKMKQKIESMDLKKQAKDDGEKEDLGAL